MRLRHWAGACLSHIKLKVIMKQLQCFQKTATLGVSLPPRLTEADPP